ncbi:hypothetical protein [Flavobacterium pectinovorum]|uniref:His-Xaa-Ser system protein HxsD n=1 Tax=Flavobacterium pectinovorum TaxID=29533 RepID=A0AB36P3U2_9FLAO|nr:hypothetical protein [Flavobacterium pectinovorum]OXB06175.1 hypothetical protein B0A72_09280 [Flavobacterium pectinovorum]SHM97119.1 hypothetical protein SAMN05444387_3632 [Flavobacterium pectinovorum]
MFNFFRKQNEIPNFSIIKNYSKKDLYFSRSKKWDWLNDKQIFLADNDSYGKIKMVTLDFWSQEMFLDANGQKTMTEYLTILINQFQKNKMEIPTDLDTFMIETLESLNNDLNAIEFSDFPIKIAPEFDNSLTEQSMKN